METSDQTHSVKWKLSSRKEHRPCYFYVSSSTTTTTTTTTTKPIHPLPFATMVTTFSTIEVPHCHGKPFFSSIFRCPIAIGSFFIFRTPNNHSKQVVGRIVSARKSVEEDDKEDHAVTVNLLTNGRVAPPCSPSKMVWVKIYKKPSLRARRLSSISIEMSMTKPFYLRHLNSSDGEPSSKAWIMCLSVASTTTKKRCKTKNLFPSGAAVFVGQSFPRH
jgi:hypothetical protein